MSDYNRGNRPRTQGAPASRFGTVQPRRGPSDRPGQRPSQAGRRPAMNASGVQQSRLMSVSAGSGVAATGGKALPKGFWPLAVVCLGILVLGLVLQGLMPQGFELVKDKNASSRRVQMISEIHSRGPVRINEIMTSNGGVLTDENGAAPDWVEIANISNGPVNLKGYVLARNSKAGNVFIFPDITLEAQSCAIVYADSHLSEDPDKPLHAPFRLSADGDVLMLFNQADVAVDTVNIPALQQNDVYARTGAETWAISEQPTPGRMNTDEDYRALTTITGTSPLKIVEVVASSDYYGPDENGICHDYVILRNTSGGTVDLSGWYLSDTQQLPRMWRFPDGVTLASGDSLLVHCSGLNRMDDPAHLHTNFKLSSEGEQVMLTDADGQPADLVNYDLMKTDAAWLLGPDGGWSVGTPTAPKVEASSTAS